MGKRKRIKLGDEQEDRITNLPRPLMGCILEHMSAMDAARTSILSKEWRYLWSETPNVVFDDEFNEKLLNNDKYAATVTNVLSSRTGPIHKFVIRSGFRINSLAPHIDRWMVTLSKTRIRKLCIHNILGRYKLPSVVQDFPELTHLQLSGCVLDADFCLKSKLVYLYLEKMEVTDKLVTSLLLPSIESLRDLAFFDCKGMEILTTIRVPHLRSFRLVRSSVFNWNFFEINQIPEYVTIKPGIQRFGQNPTHCGTVGFPKLFEILSNVGDLRLNGSSLKLLAAGGVPKVLPNVNNQLTKLCLRQFRFYRLDQVSSALCILRSSPNLRCLEISVARNRIKGMDLEPAETISVLKNPRSMDKGRLRMVKMEGLNGVKGELLFIKLVLLHSPDLQSFRFEFIRSKKQDRIAAELLQFSRASAVAKIIYNVIDQLPQISGNDDYNDNDDDDVDLNSNTDQFFV